MAGRVAGHPDLIETEAIGKRPPADRHQYDIGHQGLALAAFRRFELQRDPVIAGTAARHLGREFEAHALAGQQPLHRRTKLAIHIRQDAVEEFDDRDLGAEPRPHRPQLQPDIPPAHDGEALRHLRQRQRAGRGDNALFVDGKAGQRDAFRTGGDDDRRGLDLLVRAVAAADHDPSGRGDMAAALQPIDLVLAEQELDAAGQALDHLVLARHHRGEVEADVAELDAVLGEAVVRLGEFLG